MSPPAPPRVRLAAQLLVLGVWTTLLGAGVVLLAGRAGSILAATTVPGTAGVVLAGTRALSRAALGAALLGSVLATVGGVALLAAIR